VKQVIILIFIWYFLVPGVSLSPAQEVIPPQIPLAAAEQDRLIFRITQAGLCDYAVIPPSMAQNFTESLAITFEIFNDNPKKKIDLLSDFAYSLKDEYGNNYRPVSLNLVSLEKFVPPDITPASLYPQMVYRKTVYFERPVAASRNLLFSITADGFGPNAPITLSLPQKSIRRLAAELPKRLPQEKDFMVFGPVPGTEVHPGAVVHLAVNFPDDVFPPAIIYIFSPDYVFEDPGKNKKFDLRIPKDQPTGPFEVVVMARWNAGEELVLSKHLTLQVVRPERTESAVSAKEL